MPKVSIIVPSYNQGEYLSETLRAVLTQSHPDWECIVVDDGSTDNTRGVVEKFCKEDKRFVYLHQENRGPSAARNYGVVNSSGQYILPLDSDDLISKDYVKEAVDVFEKNTHIKLVYCNAEFFGGKTGLWLLPEYSYEELLYRNMIFCTAMYKREDYDKTSGYNENMRKGLEDWDFLLSLIKREDVVYKIAKVHFYYRIRKDSRNTTCNADDKVLKEIYHQIYLNHKELYEDHANPIFCRYQEDKLRQEIAVMQASKFWKLRHIFLKIKGMVTGEKN